MGFMMHGFVTAKMPKTGDKCNMSVVVCHKGVGLWQCKTGSMRVKAFSQCGSTLTLIGMDGIAVPHELCALARGPIPPFWRRIGFPGADPRDPRGTRSMRTSH